MKRITILLITLALIGCASVETKEEEVVQPEEEIIKEYKSERLFYSVEEVYSFTAHYIAVGQRHSYLDNGSLMTATYLDNRNTPSIKFDAIAIFLDGVLVEFYMWDETIEDYIRVYWHERLNYDGRNRRNNRLKAS